MLGPSPDPCAAFRQLERALLRRRFEAIEPRLRIELSALGALIAGFVFWQVRMRLAARAFASGPSAAALDSGLVLALLALLGGALAAGRHTLGLRGAVPGPPWLALPVSPHLVHRHLVWCSRVHALWVAVPALGVLAAGVGLMPPWWLPLLAAAFVGLLLESARAGCATAYRLAARAAEPRPGLHPVTRVLATAARRPRAERLGPAHWRRDPPWLALMRKDLLVTLRPGPTRTRALSPVALGALSCAAWALPLAPGLRHFAAFALALACAGTTAEWIVSLTGSDPFPVMKSLPLGAGPVWGARVAWVALVAIALVAGHALAAARALEPPALRLFLAWTGSAVLGIGLLGANYGVTLFPRADHAQRLLALSLGLALASSLMLPLMGWIVLLTAILHSTVRLGRWARTEAT